MDDESQTGVIAGNFYDKYNSRNPIERWLVERFLRTIKKMALASGAREALEVGCGEAHIARLLVASGFHVRATDQSEMIIENARKNLKNDHITFETCRIEDLQPDRHSAPLILAIEVLEHVTQPDDCLRRLAKLAQPHVLLSVPNEPLWRILNMARGKYLSALGNTPGHLNHWSTLGFRRLVSKYFHVEEVHTSLPWTIVRARSK